MIIGGDRYTHTITSFKERTFQITIIGVEGLGEMSIGGGIERLESYMIQNISLRRVTLVGGMGFQIIRTYLLIIWTFRLLGFDTIRIFLVFGEGIELHLTGWLKGLIQNGIGSSIKIGNNFIKEKEKNGGWDSYQRKLEIGLIIKLRCKFEKWSKN